jgi:hypothetical protein
VPPRLALCRKTPGQQVSMPMRWQLSTVSSPASFAQGEGRGPVRAASAARKELFGGADAPLMDSLALAPDGARPGMTHPI